jgi:hypothetical protein
VKDGGRKENTGAAFGRRLIKILQLARPAVAAAQPLIPVLGAPSIFGSQETFWMI